VPIFGVLAVAGFWIFASPEFIDAGYQPEQPVPYSHAVHVGKLKLDCRYCHTHVERSHEANVPPTSTCMNCHSIIKAESELLEPIRVSFETDQPMQWVRVHNLADYAYFNHASHIRAGVGCVEHSRNDTTEGTAAIDAAHLHPHQRGLGRDPGNDVGMTHRRGGHVGTMKVQIGDRVPRGKVHRHQ